MEVDMVLHERADEEVAVVVPLLRGGERQRERQKPAASAPLSCLEHRTLYCFKEKKLNASRPTFCRLRVPQVLTATVYIIARLLGKKQTKTKSTQQTEVRSRPSPKLGMAFLLPRHLPPSPPPNPPCKRVLLHLFSPKR